MTTLAITLLRFAFLILLWLFIAALVLTLRKDVYGTTIRERKPARKPAREPNHAPNPAPPPQAAPRRTPILAVTAGPLAGTTIPLSGAPLVIGRSPDSALVLDDSYSSSRHARLYLDGGQWWVEDLDSTNGTYVAGRRISAPLQLREGVPIVVGKTTMELRS
ncbi:MAG: FHA domain-containing protein FhaB/FipA [Ancrocorticia sp.]|uniref:FHA domain-containing protein FhaB/FipA n=1 Tax=Ancrocorticia sp. TaxID=2593684 RepID=UPI003F929C22